jgi:hypothetical protein
MALVEHFGWSMRQVDFESAFINSTLKETVYMKQPSGFQDGTEREC